MIVLPKLKLLALVVRGLYLQSLEKRNFYRAFL